MASAVHVAVPDGFADKAMSLSDRVALLDPWAMTRSQFLVERTRVSVEMLMLAGSVVRSR